MDHTALILIDIQKGFDDPAWGARNNPGAEAAAGRLLAHFRSNHLPVYHVHHVSDAKGSPLSGAGVAFKTVVAPKARETVIEKHAHSAFDGTDLAQRLALRNVRDLVICGLPTGACVSATARDASALGLNVTVVPEACAAFTGAGEAGWETPDRPTPQAVHDAAIASLQSGIATARTLGEILAR
ncbi:isochorismatase family protein [Celeribacter arenosi]|uniref:Cysteine hydrolase family protein n=1 Tax=Celeribacter arenosi TaxID=792649 RepID=A0ABP7JSY3_9RHOB